MLISFTYDPFLQGTWMLFHSDPTRQRSLNKVSFHVNLERLVQDIVRPQHTQVYLRPYQVQLKNKAYSFTY